MEFEKELRVSTEVLHDSLMDRMAEVITDVH